MARDRQLFVLFLTFTPADLPILLLLISESIGVWGEAPMQAKAVEDGNSYRASDLNRWVSAFASCKPYSLRTGYSCFPAGSHIPP